MDAAKKSSSTSGASSRSSRGSGNGNNNNTNNNYNYTEHHTPWPLFTCAASASNLDPKLRNNISKCCSCRRRCSLRGSIRRAAQSISGSHDRPESNEKMSVTGAHLLLWSGIAIAVAVAAAIAFARAASITVRIRIRGRVRIGTLVHHRRRLSAGQSSIATRCTHNKGEQSSELDLLHNNANLPASANTMAPRARQSPPAFTAQCQFGGADESSVTNSPRLHTNHTLPQRQ